MPQFPEPNEIQLLEASENYTIFHLTNGKKLTVPYTLKKIELMYQKDFIRVHKSYLVKKSTILEVKPKPDYKIILQTGVELPIARRRMKVIKNNHHPPTVQPAFL